jgi:hypothetical protein
LDGWCASAVAYCFLFAKGVLMKFLSILLFVMVSFLARCQTANYLQVSNPTTNAVAVYYGSQYYYFPPSSSTYLRDVPTNRTIGFVLWFGNTASGNWAFTSIGSYEGWFVTTSYPHASLRLDFFQTPTSVNMYATDLTNLDASDNADVISYWDSGLRIGGWMAAGIFGLWMISSIVSGGSNRHED